MCIAIGFIAGYYAGQAWSNEDKEIERDYSEYTDSWFPYSSPSPVLSPSPSPTPMPIPVATPTPEVEEVVLQASLPTPMSLRDWPAGDPYRLICAYSWPQGCTYARAVVSCESSFREGVDTNWPYVGWWQIDVILHADLIASMGYTTQDIYYGEPNTAVAWRLSNGGTNMTPWPSCRWQ